MFVRMTIHILMGFRHVHFCTNDYPFLFEWAFVIHISAQLTIYFFWNGFLSCTSLYEWLSISLCMGFCHAHFCTDDYHFFFYGFSSCIFLYKWLFISLCIGLGHAYFCSNDYHFFLNGFLSCTFLYEWLPYLYDFFHVCNALQHVNSMVQWQIINHIIMYIGLTMCAMLFNAWIAWCSDEL